MPGRTSPIAGVSTRADARSISLCQNRLMRRHLLIGTLVLACALCLSVVGAAQQANTDNIRNFLKVSTDFCTGGQPKPEAFAALKADGVKAVLNLRTPGEYRPDFTFEDERAAATKAGLKYFSI